MIKVLIVLFFFINTLNAFILSDDSRYIIDEYDNNLKIIWMENKKETKNSKLQNLLGKALNKTTKDISDKFDDIKIEQKAYGSISSIIEDPSIYTSKQKLYDSTFDLLDSNKNDQYVVALRVEKVKVNTYRLYGLKLFKDGTKTLVQVYELNQNIKNISVDKLSKMVTFYILSSMSDYESMNRTDSNSIIRYSDDKNTNLKIDTFKPMTIRRFTSYVEEKDFKLAFENDLVSSDKINPVTAQEYCSNLGMMLINKNFIEEDAEDEYFYEMLFEKFSFKDGWEVYKDIKPTNIDEKKFRCIDSKDSSISKTIKEYEETEIGIKYRINKDALYHSKKIVASDIESDKSSSDEDNLYVAMIDVDGLVSIWQNSDDGINMELVSKKNTGLINAKKIDLSDTMENIVIETIQESSTWKIEEGEIVKDDSDNDSTKYLNFTSGIHNIALVRNQNLDVKITMEQNLIVNRTKNKLQYWPTSLAVTDEQITVGTNSKIYTYTVDDKNKILDTFVEHTGISGDVMKILYFKENNYFVAGSTNSELVFYKNGEAIPIKTISNFGYSINDISISKNDRYLISVNGDLIVYIFDLNTILNSTIEDK